MNQKALWPEDIAEIIWQRVDIDPNKVVYTLTQEDVESVLAEKMADDGIPASALTASEIEQLVKKAGEDIPLPWQETIDILLNRDWPEPCRFDRHDPNGQGTDIFYTTTLFWTCECKQNDIHPRSQEICPVCGHVADECPDADVAEVFDHAVELPDDLTAYLREQWETFISDEETPHA